MLGVLLWPCGCRPLLLVQSTLCHWYVPLIQWITELVFTCKFWGCDCIGIWSNRHVSLCFFVKNREREAQAFGPLDDFSNLVGRGYDFGPLSLYSSQRLWSWLGLPTLGGLFTGTCSSRYIGTTSPYMALLKRTSFVSRVGINCRFVSFS
jgi:hypothetical protein